MKALRAIALLALPFAAVRGEADNALSHTRPVVIDDLALLDPGKLVSPAYLFDSVMTNGGNDSRGKYIPRNRGFVDLDKDGHEDVIISAPLSEFGRGGGSFWMYLWTNGNYRCIGEFGSHPGWIKVEDDGPSLQRPIFTGPKIPLSSSPSLAWSFHCAACPSRFHSRRKSVVARVGPSQSLSPCLCLTSRSVNRTIRTIEQSLPSERHVARRIPPRGTVF